MLIHGVEIKYPTVLTESNVETLINSLEDLSTSDRARINNFLKIAKALEMKLVVAFIEENIALLDKYPDMLNVSSTVETLKPTFNGVKQEMQEVFGKRFMMLFYHFM